MERTSHTAEASTIHEPIGSPTGPGLWHKKGRQLPAYVQHLAHHLIASGHDESRAIQIAVGVIKDWAAGHDGHGHKVHPDVQAAASKALAEWEALKAGANKSKGESRRSAAMAGPEYDADGLDASWDGDNSDLPDMTGVGVPQLEACEGHGMTPESGGMSRAAKVGTGARFKKLSAELAAKGAHDPDALAAWIGRRKYGKKAFHALASKARKGSGGGGMSRSEWRGRIYPLEDIHIVRSANERDGRIVEAYATVFEDPAEIYDDQGRYIEVIDRSAFNKVLSDVSRSSRGIQSIKVMFNHGRNLDGKPSDKYLAPIGVPVDIRPETRGLLTRTRYARTPEAENILSLIEDGAITSQSFTGRIVRSSPELAPGQRYRPKHGQLTTVRRSELGLREYGPVLWPAYSGAEILGVRMSTPGILEPDEEEIEEALPQDVEAAAGEPLARMESDEHSARYHQHALYRLRSQEIRQRIGLDW